MAIPPTTGQTSVSTVIWTSSIEWSLATSLGRCAEHQHQAPEPSCGCPIPRRESRQLKEVGTSCRRAPRRRERVLESERFDQVAIAPGVVITRSTVGIGESRIGWPMIPSSAAGFAISVFSAASSSGRSQDGVRHRVRADFHAGVGSSRTCRSSSSGRQAAGPNAIAEVLDAVAAPRIGDVTARRSTPGHPTARSRGRRASPEAELCKVEDRPALVVASR